MNLFETLEEQLRKETNFVTDNGELKKWVVLNKAQNFDEALIGLLLDNAELKDKFFATVKGTLVFNQNLFVQFWEQMKGKSFLNYNADIKKQDEHLKDFKALSLAEQKRHLCELLDRNQLYVNLSSLEDQDFACTIKEKNVTRDFYQIEK